MPTATVLVDDLSIVMVLARHPWRGGWSMPSTPMPTRWSAARSPINGEMGAKTIDAPAILGIGGSLIYFIDTYGAKGSPYDGEFDWIGERDPAPAGCGLFYIDHLTNNVFRGAMDRWYQFYQNLFNFRQIRYFDISGKFTGLTSRALTSPCGKIRIPLNESADDKSQIEEFLHQYKGEGIQHIACGCKDIYASVKRLAGRGLAFMPPPPETYYKQDRRAASRPRRASGGVAGKRSSHRWRDRRRRQAKAPLADFLEDGDWPDLFRIHRTQGRRGVWRRQF